MIRIAFYGKGGIGKSTTVSNLSRYWAERGMCVLQIGCDPKADSTLSLRGGAALPTVMEMVRRREPFALEDVICVRETEGGGRIICAEAGGPTPGQGCAGRGIITALETLRNKDILAKYSPDIILYDVLGDVVCGGFAMPMREGFANRVYVLTSGENMAIYAAANIGLAVQGFKERGYAQLGGLILNRRNVKREDEKVQELAEDLHTEVIGTLERSETVQEAEELGTTVMEAFPDSAMADAYRALANRIARDCQIRYPAAEQSFGGSKQSPLSDLSGNPARIPVGEASFPAPFTAGLEFNAPVHETWNIVHIGMLMPQAHQIYICSDNCMRGVVMTAAEMNAIERFSCVVLEEKDMQSGNLEEITLEGITDVLCKIRQKRGEEGLPKAVLVFPVCLHHFMGCDMGYVYRELEKRFPGIVFVKCWMDPIMQKTGPTPDQKLRKAMMDVLPTCESRNGQTALLGDIYALDPECELMQLIRKADEKRGTVSEPLQIQDCRTLEEYCKLSGREVMITRSPLSEVSIRQTARRLGAAPLYLPAAIGYGQIRELMEKAAQALGVTLEEAGIDPAAEEKACDDAILHLKSVIGDTPIAIDYICVQRPLGLARLLLERGLNVREVYLDAVSPEEQEDFEWLKKKHGEVLLCSTIHVKGRLLHAQGIDRQHRDYLAAGPKAAWFCGTRHFVNLVDYGGMWGYSGIRNLAALMEDAFVNEKDTEDLVPRKGLGCESIVM